MRLLFLVLAYPFLCGFVLLSREKATLPVTPASPTLNFVWDGKAPASITEKDKYKDGIYAFNDDKAMMLQLLNDAMGLWNDVPGSFVKLKVAEGQAVDSGTDQVFSILVLHDGNLSTAALAHPIPDPKNPTTIYDCDIHINDTADTASDLAFIIAHELGHCLGLGHAHTNYGAIMGYSRAMRTLTLGQDDRAGLIYLYPDPAIWDGKVKELVSCGVAGGSAPAVPLAALFLLLPLVVGATGARARDLAVFNKGAGISDQALRVQIQAQQPEQAAIIAMDPDQQRSLLNAMVDTQVLSLAGEGDGLDKDPDLVERVDQIRKLIVADAWLKRKITAAVNDDALKEFFEKNKIRFAQRQAHAVHAVFRAEDKAKEVLAAALKPGADFDAVIKPYVIAKDPVQGGDLGLIFYDQMPPEFSAAVFATKPGSVYPEVVKTSLGYHVVRVLNFQGDETVHYDAVKPQVDQAFRVDLRRRLVEELRQRYAARLDEDALKAFKVGPPPKG